ncbi:helix-turn-helix domain-containing protein [Methylophaga sp.]|jgi:cytoskeleton protein RodZ|uniref:helix-turn-helix domain-containing protein n=1 Tax=Methylophaga sp. TaxID=2024840 RepID=UPI0014012A4D|nr:helix-turn-helix domain-containing protein [Methylophaga sp.]MTI64466.1 helix-turn-helix domain-containing protein [Methylophaga sp.]
MSQTHDEPVLTRTTPTLGERLRQAREAKKYSIAEVAAQLRLTKDIVTCLENQEWERLNGRTYARGYFASYVKFLGLPYDEMLAVFNLEYTATEPAVNLRQQHHISDESQFPWFMLALIAIVLVVGWLAYQQWQAAQMAQQNAALSSEINEQTEQDPNQDNFAESIVEPLDSTLPDNSEPEADMAEPVTDDMGEQEEGAAPLLTDDSVAETTAAETDNITQAEGQPETQQIQEAEAPTLRMTFSGECWVEVTSANAKVLVSQVMQAEQSLELPVEQPLQILLGRADVVTIYYNNEQVDLEPYTQGDVARLTLGVDS